MLSDDSPGQPRCETWALSKTGTLISTDSEPDKSYLAAVSCWLNVVGVIKTPKWKPAEDIPCMRVVQFSKI